LILTDGKRDRYPHNKGDILPSEEIFAESSQQPYILVPHVADFRSRAQQPQVTETGWPRSVASLDDTSGLSVSTSNNPICICRASPTVEVTTPNELPVRLALGKDDPVEHVEHFLAEIEPKIFGKMEALGKAEVLVENRERSSKARIQCCQNVVIPTFAGVPRISATETAFRNRRGFCR
jgi:hypothetical protein